MTIEELTSAPIDVLPALTYGRHSAERVMLETHVRALAGLANIHDELAEEADRASWVAGVAAVEREFGFDYYLGRVDRADADATMRCDVAAQVHANLAAGHHAAAQEYRAKRLTYIDALADQLNPPF